VAIRPEIALQARVPDFSQTFVNTLTGIQKLDSIRQNREQRDVQDRFLEARAQSAEAKVPTAQSQFNTEQSNLIRSVATGAREVIPDLEAGNIDSAISTMQRRSEALTSAGISNTQTEEGIALAKSNPQELLRISKDLIALDDRLNPQQGRSNPKAFAPITDPQTGQQSSTVFNPNTNSFSQVQIPGATQLTPAQRSDIAVTEFAKKADIEVTKTSGTERVKQRERRSSSISKELSERNRAAARSSRTLNQALTIAQQSSQGLTGVAKLKLSQIIPGIDVSNEAALDSTMKQLALEQLQNFKGPTTDFEFGVAQQVSGSLGQSRTSNIARIKSLRRATWFNEREFSQFKKHTKSGGDPDSFKFNFGEPVRTKKGVFTLQDIQDTAVKNNLTIEETLKALNK